MKPILFILFFSISLSCFGQQVLINDEGDKFIIHENGTWKKIVDDGPQVAKVSRSGCQYKMNQTDQFTEEEHIIMEFDTLVSFTPDSLASQQRHRAYFTGMAHLAFVSSDKGLFLNWNVHSTEANLMGGLSEGNLVTLEFQNTEPVKLEVAKEATVKLKADKGYTRFSTFVRLNDLQAELVADHPLKSIRINWDNQEISFPVENPGLLMDQVDCIELAMQ